MNIQQIRKQVFLCMMSCVFAVGLSAPAQQNSQPATAPFASATVADVKGKAQLQLPGHAPSAPTRGQVLPPETTINTENGRILLRLEDGSEVLVLPHTRLVLKQPNTTSWHRLQLALGRIKAEIQKRISGSPTFQMGTPSAVISVRGTRFYVEVDKRKATTVHVEEGVVQLESAKGIGAAVLVKAGFSSRVGEDSAPEPPKPTDEFKKESGKGNEGNGRGGHSSDQGHMNPQSNPHGSRPGRRP